nr:MAG TPA: hypothetical protein [Caudoviricetes sp.]
MQSPSGVSPLRFRPWKLMLSKLKRLFVPLLKPSTGLISSGGHLRHGKRKTEAIVGLLRLSLPEESPFPSQ